MPLSAQEQLTGLKRGQKLVIDKTGENVTYWNTPIKVRSAIIVVKNSEGAKIVTSVWFVSVVP